MRLANQVAIVTGGNRGIGAEISRAFAREGAAVVIAAQNDGLGRAVAEEVNAAGGRAEFIKTDVTQKDAVDALLSHTIDQYGGLHILVNNAGSHEKAPFWEEPASLWERMYQVNVMGTVLPSQAAVKHMKDNGGGSIVHMASKAGVVGEPGHAAYSASKGAIISLTRAMAVELAPFGIRVNAICPGPVMTDMLLEAVPDKGDRERLAARAPLMRVGTPQDIAGAAVYLGSSESDWCTGQTINIDGGMSVLL